MIEILIIFACGFVVGWWLHSHILLARILSNPRNMINLLEKYEKAKDEEDADEPSQISREVTVEHEQGSFYLYTKDNNEFVGQGKTVEEALEAAHKRYPKQTFKGVIPAEQAKAWGLSKQN